MSEHRSAKISCRRSNIFFSRSYVTRDSISETTNSILIREHVHDQRIARSTRVFEVNQNYRHLDQYLALSLCRFLSVSFFSLPPRSSFRFHPSSRTSLSYCVSIRPRASIVPSFHSVTSHTSLSVLSDKSCSPACVHFRSCFYEISRTREEKRTLVSFCSPLFRLVSRTISRNDRVINHVRIVEPVKDCDSVIHALSLILGNHARLSVLHLTRNERRIEENFGSRESKFFDRCANSTNYAPTF